MEECLAFSGSWQSRPTTVVLPRLKSASIEKDKRTFSLTVECLVSY